MSFLSNKAASFIAGAVAAVGLASTSQASLIASESFSYSDNNTATWTGGTGWATGSAWTGTSGPVKTIVNAGMSYTPSGGSTISGGTQSLQATLVANATTVVQRSLATAQTVDLYYSYLVKVPAGGSLASGKFAALFLSQNESIANDSPMAGIRPATTFNGTTYPDSGNGDKNPFLARWNTSGVVGPKASGYAEDTTFLIVAKLTKNTTSGFYEGMHFWVNPSATESFTVGTGGYAGFAAQPGSPSLTQVTSVRFRADGATSNTVQWDELRIGTTFADVVPVPEPGTAIAGVGGLLALLGRRRRPVR